MDWPGLCNIDICLYLLFVIGWYLFVLVVFISQYFLEFVGGVALSTEVDGLGRVAQQPKLVFALRPVLSVVHPGASQHLPIHRYLLVVVSICHYVVVLQKFL